MEIMLNRRMKPIAAFVGTAFAASLATVSVANADELFATAELDTGYDLLAQVDAEGKCGEGKCGEGKCGEGEGEGEGEGDDGAEGKCGEGKCGEDTGEEEGDAEEGDEGKDGEGKCGGAA